MYGYTDMNDVFQIKTLYTAFTEEIDSDYFFVGERHNFWELVIALDGEIGVTAGENAWMVKKGQAVLHPPMEFHRIWYAGNSGKILVLSFGAKGLPYNAGGSFRAELTEAETLLAQIRNSFHMEDIHIRGLRTDMLEAQQTVKRWELYLLGLVSQKKQLTHEERSGPAKNYAAIVKVLEDHVHENLSVERIAQLCNMSQASVKQTFSRYAGMGIINYFNRLKIEAAIDMLRSGSSVQETAATLDFSSQNYFSTVFKRITGKTPTAYK